LISKIFEAAIEAGAESIITACPLCQANLDTRQREAAGVSGKQWEIPIIFISELMAEAFGSDKTQKLYRKHFVSPASRKDNSDIESSGARR
jgi:heterodisulfide reductase subunit B